MLSNMESMTDVELDGAPPVFSPPDSSQTTDSKSPPVVLSQVSTLDVTSDVYRTKHGHGAFHRKQKNPRGSSTTDWMKLFRQRVSVKF